MSDGGSNVVKWNMGNLQYDPKYNKIAYRLVLLGHNDQRIADIFGIGVQALGNWKKQYPDFAQAWFDAGPAADGRVAEGLYKRACGFYADEFYTYLDANGDVVQESIKKYYPPDARAASSWLGARQRALWNQPQQVQVSGSNGGAIKQEMVISIDPIEAIKAYQRLSEE